MNERSFKNVPKKNRQRIMNERSFKEVPLKIITEFMNERSFKNNATNQEMQSFF